MEAGWRFAFFPPLSLPSASFLSELLFCIILVSDSLRGEDIGSGMDGVKSDESGRGVGLEAMLRRNAINRED